MLENKAGEMRAATMNGKKSLIAWHGPVFAAAMNPGFLGLVVCIAITACSAPAPAPKPSKHTLSSLSGPTTMVKTYDANGRETRSYIMTRDGPVKMGTNQELADDFKKQQQLYDQSQLEKQR